MEAIISTKCIIYLGEKGSKACVFVLYNRGKLQARGSCSQSKRKLEEWRLTLRLWGKHHQFAQCGSKNLNAKKNYHKISRVQRDIALELPN